MGDAARHDDEAPHGGHRGDLNAGLVAFAIAALPALAAVWALPGFVTQDGPAHLYNAQILLESTGDDSPFARVYEVRARPLPNWLGHLTLAGLLAVATPWVADRLMLAITLVGFAGSIAWLRWRVAGPRGLVWAAPMAVLLGLNVTWLLGFSGFLLGACLFPITLGVWWSGRRRLGAGRVAAIAALLVVGYFGHLVSLGLTAIGLGVLALATPGPGRRRRIGLTLVAMAPIGPLAILYRGLTREGGSFRPVWEQLDDPLSASSWFRQLGWVDPITLGSKSLVPLVEAPRTIAAGLIAPVVWLGLAMAAMLAATWIGPRGPARAAARSERRGFGLLATLLIVGGLVAPDGFGTDHGAYLPQRLVLLGLVAIVPILDPDPRRPLGALGVAALVVALTAQSAYVWDYGLRSDRLIGQFLKARDHVGGKQRVGTLLIGIRGEYKANPLLHADCLLGVGDRRKGFGIGTIVWSNYETRYYYFPVRIRPDVSHPPVVEFERVAILDGPADRDERARRWEALLAGHHREIDTLVVWGDDPRLDAIAGRWFDPRPVFREGPVCVLRRRVDGEGRRTGPSPSAGQVDQVLLALDRPELAGPGLVAVGHAEGERLALQSVDPDAGSALRLVGPLGHHEVDLGQGLGVGPERDRGDVGVVADLDSQLVPVEGERASGPVGLLEIPGALHRLQVGRGGRLRVVAAAGADQGDRQQPEPDSGPAHRRDRHRRSPGGVAAAIGDGRGHSSRSAPARPGADPPRDGDDATFRPTVQVRQGRGAGSGTIVATADGETLVLTAAHVVDDRRPIAVELHRYNLGREGGPAAGRWPIVAAAEVVARDRAGDLALLSLAGKRALPFVARLGDLAEEPARGATVSTVGIDGGRRLSGWTTTVRGTIALARATDDPDDRRLFLVTEHPPVPGRSGGGLFDADGRLIGVCIGRIEADSGRDLGLFASARSIRRLLAEAARRRAG